MCKKILILLTLMMSVFAFSACSAGGLLGDSDMDIYEKIHKYYLDMEGYSAKLSFTCCSNKTQNSYFAEQLAKAGGSFYTNVTPGDKSFSVTTVCDGKKIKTVFDGSDYALLVPNDKTLGLLFVDSFFKTYYASEDTVLSVNKDSGESKQTVLEVTLPEDQGSGSISLTIDNKTLAPVSLMLKDFSGKTKVYAEFSEFKYNDKKALSFDYTQGLERNDA